MMRSMLFAYGTLMPRDRESAAREGWQADAVRGRLYDLGLYPALIDLDDPGAGWVEGFVRPVDSQELKQRLDPYEAVDQGPYRRAWTTTRNQHRAWVYVYDGRLPPHARGPLARWEAAGPDWPIAPILSGQGDA
jgi:gamma-glutamylcyclotransferase (GGCT)/AIG2-like uncharacterized protein YtfP